MCFKLRLYYQSKSNSLNLPPTQSCQSTSCPAPENGICMAACVSGAPWSYGVHYLLDLMQSPDSHFIKCDELVCEDF